MTPSSRSSRSLALGFGAALLAGLVAMCLTVAAADTPRVVVSEVQSAGNSSTTYGADWFELTNLGTSALDITGWKMDDNSNAFANAVALRGVTSIPAGSAVVFLEGSADGTGDATLLATSPPRGSEAQRRRPAC